MPERISLPYPFVSTDKKNIQRYRYAMINARDLALEKPLHYSLVLPLKLTCKATASPMSRPLPWFAGKEGTYACQLLNPLQAGPDKYSQVWVAVVKPIDETSVAEEAKIVLKIFQPSLSIIPHPEYDWKEQYAVPEVLAKNEDQAYHELMHIQGVYVPYYYGMQEVSFSFIHLTF